MRTIIGQRRQKRLWRLAQQIRQVLETLPASDPRYALWTEVLALVEELTG